MASEASVYLAQIRGLANEIESFVTQVPVDQFSQRPGPHLNPVSWNYFHLLRVWDLYFNWECREQPQDEDAWQRGGFSEKSGYRPDGKGGKGLGIGFGYTDDEVDELQLDPAVLIEYQRQLLGEIEAFLQNASDDDLRRETHSVVHAGETNSVARRMQHLILHSYQHLGEMRYALGALGWRDASYRIAEAGE